MPFLSLSFKALLLSGVAASVSAATIQCGTFNISDALYGTITTGTAYVDSVYVTPKKWLSTKMTGNIKTEFAWIECTSTFLYIPQSQQVIYGTQNKAPLSFGKIVRVDDALKASGKVNSNATCLTVTSLDTFGRPGHPRLSPCLVQDTDVQHKQFFARTNVYGLSDPMNLVGYQALGYGGGGYATSLDSDGNVLVGYSDTAAHRDGFIFSPQD